MPHILVRDLSAKAVARLKKLAKGSGRSLQAEARRILETQSLIMSMDQFREECDRFCDEVAERAPQQTDSADLIREDRDR